MTYQRVDKKNPKIVPKDDLQGFCYKDSSGNKTFVDLEEYGSTVIEQPNSHDLIIVEIANIPHLVKALWAVFTEAELRNLEGVNNGNS